MTEVLADNTVQTRIPRQLRESDVHGKGAAEIGWGSPGDFARCQAFMRRHGVPGYEIDGACANLHKLATGEWPGRNAHKGHLAVAAVISLTAAMGDYDKITWEGPLAVVGEATGDRRRFPYDTLKYQSFPQPFRFQRQGLPGHQGAVTVGVIEDAREQMYSGQQKELAGKRVIWGRGYFLNPQVVPEVNEAIHLAEHGVSGPSVDLDSYTAVLKKNALSGETTADMVRGRQRAATLVSVPAFADLRITITRPQSLTASMETFAVNAQGWRGEPIAPREAEFNADHAAKRIEAWANGDPAKMAKMFLWVDTANGPLLGRKGYRLPWGDIIDEKPMLIYHAVYAAAALLQGGHGGLPNIPEEEKGKLRTVISSIYEELAQEFDDASIVAPWDHQQQASGEPEEGYDPDEWAVDEDDSEYAETEEYTLYSEAFDAALEEFRRGHRYTERMHPRRRPSRHDHGGEWEDVPGHGPHGQIKVGGKWVYPPKRGEKGYRNPAASVRAKAKRGAGKPANRSETKVAKKAPEHHGAPAAEHKEPVARKAPVKKAVAKKPSAKRPSTEEHVDALRGKNRADQTAYLKGLSDEEVNSLVSHLGGKRLEDDKRDDLETEILHRLGKDSEKDTTEAERRKDQEKAQKLREISHGGGKKTVIARKQQQEKKEPEKKAGPEKKAPVKKAAVAKKTTAKESGGGSEDDKKELAQRRRELKQMDTLITASEGKGQSDTKRHKELLDERKALEDDIKGLEDKLGVKTPEKKAEVKAPETKVETKVPQSATEKRIAKLEAEREALKGKLGLAKDKRKGRIQSSEETHIRAMISVKDRQLAEARRDLARENKKTEVKQPETKKAETTLFKRLTLRRIRDRGDGGMSRSESNSEAEKKELNGMAEEGLLEKRRVGRADRFYVTDKGHEALKGHEDEEPDKKSEDQKKLEQHVEETKKVRKTTVVSKKTGEAKEHKLSPAQDRTLKELGEDPGAGVHPGTRKVLEREGYLDPKSGRLTQKGLDHLGIKKQPDDSSGEQKKTTVVKKTSVVKKVTRENPEQVAQRVAGELSDAKTREKVDRIVGDLKGQSLREVETNTGVTSKGTVAERRARLADAVMTRKGGEGKDSGEKKATEVKKATAARTPEEHKAALDKMTSRDEARDYLAGVKGKELDELTRDLNLGTTGTVGEKRQRILQSQVGSRLDSKAIERNSSQGKTSVGQKVPETKGPNTKEQAARDRQERLDKGAAVGELAAEIASLHASGVDGEVMRRRIDSAVRRAEGKPGEAEVRKLAEQATASTHNSVRAALAREGLSKYGVRLTSEAGGEESFDPAKHESIGGAIRKGQKVTVVRSGVMVREGDTEVQVSKSKVEKVTPPKVPTKTAAEKDAELVSERLAQYEDLESAEGVIKVLDGLQRRHLEQIARSQGLDVSRVENAHDLKEKLRWKKQSDLFTAQQRARNAEWRANEEQRKRDIEEATKASAKGPRNGNPAVLEHPTDRGNGRWWERLKHDTGPEGLRVKDVTIQGDSDPYIIKSGTVYRRNGVSYLIEDGEGVIAPSTVAAQFEKLHESLPPDMVRFQKAYVWVQGRNPFDPFWEKHYKTKGFTSLATAGDESVRIWNRKNSLAGPGTMEETLRHEFGHNVSFQLAKEHGQSGPLHDSAHWHSAVHEDSDVENRKPWMSKVKVAMLHQGGMGRESFTLRPDHSKDFPDGVSSYGKSAVSEDFAEATAMYMHKGPLGLIARDGRNVPVYFRDLFPGRARVLDRLFPELAKEQRRLVSERGPL